MSVSTPWTNSTPASAARNNKTGVISVDGNTAGTLDKTKHRVVFVTSTGSGGNQDDFLVVNAAENAYINLRDTASHTHTGSTTGGSFADIVIANPKFYDLILTKTTDLYESNWSSPVYWIRTVTSTGSVENSTDGTTGERSIRLRPNATSGSGATISYPHLKLDFGATSIFQTKILVETASSIAFHVGVACDDITAADSNTRKLQAELCTTTNNNYWLRTATGSANSASDTGIAFSVNRAAIKILHYPTLGTPRADLYIDSGTVLQKTTNIPTSGATADNNLVKFSVKNSIAADRPLKFYGCRLRYSVSDNWV